MLNIGNMNRRVTIERNLEIVKASGDVAHVWTPVATIWAEVLQQTAAEFLAGFGAAENSTVIFRLRYRPDISTSERVTLSGTVYAIKEVKELGQRDGLELCVEVTR